ncbi:alpha/beta fold hydrolase [Actinokineospora sp.]|uniref:alpha/beta fold hydrolase n=1 Tax=Actinokineospora sp. TaxID=1872133 RepID=UPI004037EC16
MDNGLFVERGGTPGPTLVLLHGLGATGDVWSGLRDLLADAWPGGWVIPDLPGHGRSSALPGYSFGALAAEVARAVGPGPVAVLGHSLGGVVGLTLASGWFGVRVVAACGVGIKVSWAPAELAKAAALAAKPARVFGTAAEALDRAARVAGLPTASPDARLIAADGDGWRLALDPGAFAVGRPDLPGLLAAARAEVTLAAGETDPMSQGEHLRALVPDPVILAGLGHNAHVDDPAALLALVERLRAAW